ncbi:MAG: chemotaxis protein CheX [Firmicutes bacterium]|nr:chemotaxis protein CheX [Bacillota bacterium]
MAIIMRKGLFYSPLLNNEQGVNKLEKLYQSGVQSLKHKLSSFFPYPVETELTGFFFLPFSWLIQNLEHTPTAEIGFHSRVTGDLKGELYLCFSRETAMELVSMEMKRNRTIHKHFQNKVDESFLSELTNILIHTFWHSLHEELTTRWWLTPPVMIQNLLKSIQLASKIYSFDRRVLLAEISAYRPNFKMELIFIPAGGSLNHFLAKLEDHMAQAETEGNPS